MPRSSWSITRRIRAAALSAVVLGTVVFNAPATGAQPVVARPSAQTQTPTVSLGDVTVQREGHGAWVAFTSSEPTSATVSARLLAQAPTQPTRPGVPPRVQDVQAGGLDPGILSNSAPNSGPLTYERQHRLHVPNLASNTAYTVQVAAATSSGQRVTRSVQVTTLKERVRVTLRQIQIDDDGDLVGAGEPLWVAAVDWTGGTFNGCYPNNGAMCQHGSWREGIIVPRTRAGGSLTWLFAEENFDTFPDTFTLRATAEEDDLVPGGLLDCVANFNGCPFQGHGTVQWRVPQGVEFASTSVSVGASDTLGGFQSQLQFTFELLYDNASYPVTRRNIPSTTWWD